MIEGLRLSENSFSIDTNTLVMRSDLPLAFRRYYEYRARSFYLEAGFVVGVVHKALREELNSQLGKDQQDWKFEKCLLDIFDDESTNDGHDLIQLPLNRLQTLREITLFSLAVSTLLLIAEISYWIIWNFYKKVNVRNRTKRLKSCWNHVQPTVFYLSERNVRN